MKIQRFMKNDKEIIWSTENLVLFGTWLIQRGDYGYGFLCIHGACLGLKIGTLLKLKWSDFINTERFGDGEADYHYDRLILEDSKKNSKQVILLSRYIQGVTGTFLEENYNKYEIETDENIYVNAKTKKVLSTTSLNRELNKLHSEFEEYIFKTTFLRLKLRPLKSNTMEIAWARDMVNKYNCTKKVFITVSKYMGHRTVNDTIKLLELEPDDNIRISHDMYEPTIGKINRINNLFKDSEELKNYLSKEGQNITSLTSEFIKNN